MAVTTPVSRPKSTGTQSAALRDSVKRTLLAKLVTHEGEIDDSERCIQSAQVNASCTRQYLPRIKEFKEALDGQYRELQVQEIVTEDGKVWLIVHRLFMDPEAGPLQNPRLCLIQDGDQVFYKWQVYYSTCASGTYTRLSDVAEYLKQLEPLSGYVMCPGIREYPSLIRFKTKHLMEWDAPFNRKFSSKCSLWHVPNNIHQAPESAVYNCCKACKQLSHDIVQLKRKAISTTEADRMARTSTSSNYPISKLSPASHDVRTRKISQERKSLATKINALTKFDCDLKEKQHTELLALVSDIQSKSSESIQELIREGDRILGKENNLLRDAWRQDVIERLQYEKDQSKAVSGRTGNRWNQITIRMALAVYTRSPAAYEALRDFKLLQLPSVRTLKYYIDANLESAGNSMERLQQSRKQYVAFTEEKRKESMENKATTTAGEEREFHLPTGDGVLIIDEVKVGLKLLWSSRSQKFIGHAMTHDELASLCDVYTTLSPDYRTKQTTYVLQTLWRDLTSDFDVIGPHYTSESSFEHKALCPILLDAIRQFHICGFDVVAVVCDGASSNLTMIKELSGAPRKAYRYDPGASEPFKLKNMVSALFQCRPQERGGTRAFSIGGQEFGWKVIADMYHRDLARIRAGQCSRIPKLKESHIIRDSWTRLNVLPSKVMQQDEVIAELKEYAESKPAPQDAASVKQTILYLSALNNLFERSLLGQKVRVFNAEGSTIQRMEKAFQFFASWAEKQQTNKEDKKSFLAWQTWDLLRVMWFGFKGLTREFLSDHPGYYINPRRLNGSAVETLFGQLKHTTGRNLTAVNYETAKATMLTKRQSKGKDSYRSAALYVRHSDLMRK